MAAAGAARCGSGAAKLTLDGALPLRGVGGDCLHSEMRGPPKAPVAKNPLGLSLRNTGFRDNWTDVHNCESMPRDEYSPRMLGHAPRMNNNPRAASCIPGYTGHIQGKYAENVHAATFQLENERALKNCDGPFRTGSLSRTFSSPASISCADTTRGLSCSSRVPGYMGNIPGKFSESVHGMRVGDANEEAQSLRCKNPHVCSDGWLKRGRWPVDRMPTYQFQGRVLQADMNNYFSIPQQDEALAMNRKLGRTFGLKPAKVNKHKAGDRYLHHLFDPTAKRMDPSTMQRAGQPSASPLLDQDRWRCHNALIMGNGNQRTAGL